MIKIILKWLALTGAVLFASYVIPGMAVSSFGTAIIVALVLGLINISIKPVLKLLTLPINIITLGIFGLVLNVVLFWVVSLVVPGFTLSGIVPAIIGSAVVSIIMWIADIIL